MKQFGNMQKGMAITKHGTTVIPFTRAKRELGPISNKKKNKNKIANRYGIYYLHDSRAIDWRRFSSRAGFTNDLTSAIGRACWHIGMDNYYPKAIIVDRHEMRIVRIINRTKDGISIVEKDGR